MTTLRKCLLTILFLEILATSFVAAMAIQPVEHVRVNGSVGPQMFGVVAVQVGEDSYFQYMPSATAGLQIVMDCNRGLWVDVLVDCRVWKIPGADNEVNG